ncbi:DUF59 domain-containing protein [Candidatus Woesearchaeota archaeon]|nr:DUF59 domain-containing protein [Candidatus Woesearchaeota archaeon]
MITKEELIEKVFKKYVDKEIDMDVWTLGLVYNLEVVDNKVMVTMTFTSPLCPYGPQMVEEIKQEIKKLGAVQVQITVTFEPLWQPSEELKEMLGF